MKGHTSFRLAIALLISMALVLSSVSTAATKTLTFQSQPPLPPPNDNFADAKVIPSPLPFSDTVNNAVATTELDEPQYCTYSPNTVWYSMTPTTNEIVVVDMNGSSIAETTFTVYRAVGPGITGLQEVGCASWLGNAVQFPAQAGTTYYFQAGSWSGGGDLRLNVRLVPPPSNDDFADAMVITALPFDSQSFDTSAATVEPGEPGSACGYAIHGTVWFKYTPAEDGSVSAHFNSNYWTALAAYTGTTLADLTTLGCRMDWGRMTFKAEAGRTYYFQVGTVGDLGGSLQFFLEVAPPPYADFGFYPSDPSVFEPVSFNNWSSDPADVGIQSQAWDFGDGGNATDPWPSHRYTADGDYTVRLTVTTFDGRTASTTRVVQVRTHDVAITKLSAPQSASAGQTRQIAVEINSKRFVENVEVQLYKSVPGGYQWFGTLTQQVPVRPSNRTTTFNFSYTFTKDDATIGKVTFKAVANIQNARDALPADNEAIAPPTKVSRK